MTTASYWNMNRGSRKWSNVVPPMIHSGVYGSVRHYLKAIKAAGTDKPMAKMRQLPIEGSSCMAPACARTAA